MPSARASSFSAVDIPRGRPLTLLVDYDGTLVPIAPTPDLAKPDAELLGLLGGLATRPDFDLHIVSGRRREMIDVWFGHLPLSLWAEHGFWHRSGDGSAWEPAAALPLDALKQTLPILETFTKTTLGSFIEQKTASLAWHYRLVDPKLAQAQSHALRAVLEEALENTPLEVLLGKKVVEIRLRGINKALVARRVLAEHHRIAAVLAIGDDETDDELFRVLPDGSVTIAVGTGPTCARYHVENHQEARNVLRLLID